MREIKFRAWDKDAGVMFCIFDNTTQKEFYIPAVSHERYDIMQYTGLKDKNGKEIYKSDLIKAVDEILEVIWHYNRWVMKNVKTGRIKEFRQIDHVFYEIIGNIDENPELLNA